LVADNRFQPNALSAGAHCFPNTTGSSEYRSPGRAGIALHVTEVAFRDEYPAIALSVATMRARESAVQIGLLHS
jgi:hypothetical protein